MSRQVSISGPRSKRRATTSSLRLSPSKLADIPIPPSLLQSPHLNSPQSAFQRAIYSPRTPSEEEERWLRDTVPLSSKGTTILIDSSEEIMGSPGSPRAHATHSVIQPERRCCISRGRAMSHMRQEAPRSPPLIRPHHFSDVFMINKNGRGQSSPQRHAARTAEQDYFLHVKYPR